MAETPPFDPQAYTLELRRNWDEASSHYARLSAEHFPSIAEAFLDFSGLRPGMRLLDLACGPGTLTGPAARRVAPSQTVVGLDLSPAMTALAAEKAAREGLAGVSFRQGNAEELAFKDASFDAVLCQLGLMLFARPERALAEMRRVASPGGTVGCLVQGTAEGMVFTSLLMKCSLKHAPELKIPGAPTMYGFGPRGVLKSAFVRAGLEKIEERRLSGTFAFASPEAYWESMTAASGRMRRFLGALAPPTQEAIRRDVLSGAAAYAKGGRLAIPYEFVMARGQAAQV